MGQIYTNEARDVRHVIRLLLVARQGRLVRVAAHAKSSQAIKDIVLWGAVLGGVKQQAASPSS